MSRKLPMRNSVVLITGAGSGIGRLMALEAARRGAKEVVIWDRDEERAEAVRQEVEKLGSVSRAEVVDVTNTAAVEKAGEKLDRVDVLINNAGVVSGRDFLETTDEAVERTFAVNTLALFRVTRQFLPGMILRHRGTVLNIASAAGLVGVSKQTDYSASKWAAVGFSESLRAEMKKHKTGVNVVVACPYYIDTGMFDGVKSRFPLLLPILKQEDVARKFIDGVEQGKQQIVLPFLVRFLPALRIFPVPVFDWVCNVLGVNATMDEFHGRVGDRI